MIIFLIKLVFDDFPTLFSVFGIPVNSLQDTSGGGGYFQIFTTLFIFFMIHFSDLCRLYSCSKISVQPLLYLMYWPCQAKIQANEIKKAQTSFIVMTQ